MFRVSAGGTAEEPEAPWHVVFLDADLADDGNPYPLLRQVSVQNMTRQLDVTTAWDTQHQWIDEAAISLRNGHFLRRALMSPCRSNDINTDTAVQAEILETKLRLIGGLEAVTVSYDQGQTPIW